MSDLCIPLGYHQGAASESETVHNSHLRSLRWNAPCEVGLPFAPPQRYFPRSDRTPRILLLLAHLKTQEHDYITRQETLRATTETTATFPVLELMVYFGNYVPLLLGQMEAQTNIPGACCLLPGSLWNTTLPRSPSTRQLCA